MADQVDIQPPARFDYVLKDRTPHNVTSVGWRLLHLTSAAIRPHSSKLGPDLIMTYVYTGRPWVYGDRLRKCLMGRAEPKEAKDC